MHKTFHITTDDIRRLTDEQSRELVARLCRAELRIKNVSEAAVAWGGDQRAKDGGVDVRVDIEPPARITGYVKADHSAFQVKAEKFAAGKIAGEMAPKGVLRPAIKALAESRGAYVIASTRDSLSDISRLRRIGAMSACLSDHGLAGKVIVDFYDCRKIADWVEQYPAIAHWVRDNIGKPLEGWKPYGPWAYQETDVKADYLIDDKVKIFVPNADEGSDVLSAINRLRSDLNQSVSIRIVGLSGVGKTRLVQALFDNRIVTEIPALDPENVIYADLSDRVTPQPSTLMEVLVSDNSECIVIIDNCGPDVHRRLTELQRRPGSKVRLITIEYDIRDDLPEGTVCYRLEGSSDDVVRALLKRKYHILSGNDLDKIVEFSDGNARVAFALASTAAATGELGRLRDTELFKRLFVQKNVESDELLRCAERASLLYSFDGEESGSESEMAILASLAEVSVIAFSRNISMLRQRGLLQQRGQWRAVLPHAIANRLAAQAVDVIPATLLIDRLVENASERIARSFSRRLGFLHDSERVRKIVQKWLSPGGLYGNLTELNEIGRQIFSNIAPVDEEAALSALERAIRSENFVSIENTGRSYYARVARSLAYDSALFDRAGEVLLQFAMAEPDDYKMDSTRDTLKSLFYCHLSGTESSPDQRSRFVRKLMLSDDKKEQLLGLFLLNAALESFHFTSSHGFEFGARKRGYGWWPRTRSDVFAWYGSFLCIAVEVGKTDSQLGRDVREILGNALRGLWVNAGVSDHIASAANELKKVDGWPEGWLGLRRILQFDKERINHESLEDVRKLERDLAPRDLKSNIRAKVLNKGAFFEELDEDENEETLKGHEEVAHRHRRVQDEAESLGRTAAIDANILYELLPALLSSANASSKTWSFGFGIGSELCDMAALLAEMKRLIASTDPNSLSLILLRGLISGWHKRNAEGVSAFLDGAVCDDVWGKYFPELQFPVVLDDVGYARLLKSLALHIAPAWQYGYLCLGRVTDPLTIDQISVLAAQISSKPNGGVSVAIDLLRMVIHCSKEKDADYRRDLAEKCISYIRGINWAEVQIDHASACADLREILDFAVASTKSESDVCTILHDLLSYERSLKPFYPRELGGLLTPFFKFYPRQTLDAVYVADADGRYRRALRIVIVPDIDQQATAIRAAPAEALITWCDVSPEDRYLFAAQACSLFEKKPASRDGFALSDVAHRILAKARDKEAVLRIFIDRFRPRSWSGRRSVILRERLPLLATLNPADDQTLKGQIAMAEEELIKEIAIEEAHEEAREKERIATFE